MATNYCWIQTTGPISIAAFMWQVLTNPDGGYYTTRGRGTEIFGTKGDFITSPEISQVFGELVGIWTVAEWMAQGQVSGGVELIEVGPGKGTLMADILRVSGRKALSPFLRPVVYVLATSDSYFHRRFGISRLSRRILRPFTWLRLALRLGKCKKSFCAAMRPLKRPTLVTGVEASVLVYQSCGLRISDFCPVVSCRNHTLP